MQSDDHFTLLGFMYFYNVQNDYNVLKNDY